jgi:hypothetical protein
MDFERLSQWQKWNACSLSAKRRVFDLLRLARD